MGSLVACGTLLLGFEELAWARLVAQAEVKNSFAGGRQIGVVEFSHEAPLAMETALGEGLDGRMYTDLSRLTPEAPIIANESFYIRTRASALLHGQEKWIVQLNGLGTKAVEIGVAELKKMAQAMGVHVMECAGNARSVHFGLMSAAEWSGVPLVELLENAKMKPQSARILVSGFDTYPTKSESSQPGASWVFSWDDLHKARAFLATEMNGKVLTKDHGEKAEAQEPRRKRARIDNLKQYKLPAIKICVPNLVAIGNTSKHCGDSKPTVAGVAHNLTICPHAVQAAWQAYHQDGLDVVGEDGIVYSVYLTPRDGSRRGAWRQRCGCWIA